MIHDGPPHSSNEGYSYAKRMLEVHSRLYRSSRGVDFVTVIPTNVYGNNDNFNLQNSHVVPGLIHKCFLAKMNVTPMTIAGSGTPLRQFMYASFAIPLTPWLSNTQLFTQQLFGGPCSASHVGSSLLQCSRASYFELRRIR